MQSKQLEAIIPCAIHSNCLLSSFFSLITSNYSLVPAATSLGACCFLFADEDGGRFLAAGE